MTARESHIESGLQIHYCRPRATASAAIRNRKRATRPWSYYWILDERIVKSPTRDSSDREATWRR